MQLDRYFKKQAGVIEKQLERILPKPAGHAAELYQAMRYAVLSGGKRIRPIFVLAACEAVGGRARQVMPAALAIELIHSYSLVHDDLPCMDNDLTRRGKPSCHAKFGELTALLAGDALLTQAFQVMSLSQAGFGPAQSAKRMQASAWIAQAAGYQGMIEGQAMDMKYQNSSADLPILEGINAKKSGELIAVSLRTGAYLGGGSASEVRTLFSYGRSVGLLFQVVDDIMDSQGYAQVLGVPQAREQAERLLSRALAALKPLGPKRGARLREIAEFVSNRTE